MAQAAVSEVSVSRKRGYLKYVSNYTFQNRNNYGPFNNNKLDRKKGNYETDEICTKNLTAK